MDPSLTSPDAVPLWPFGARDFVQYWSAFHLLMQGHNPYDSLQMLGVQESIGFPGELPVLMWNPPWLLILLAPLLWLDFSTATMGWVVLNGIILGSLPWIVGQGAEWPGSRTRFLFIAALTLIFLPALDCIRSGQLGVFLALGTALVIRSLRSGNTLVGGVGLAILSIKPHLAFMIALAMLFRMSRARVVVSVVIWGVALTCALAALGLLLRSSLLMEWAVAMLTKPAVGIAIMEWRTDTVASLLREFALILGSANSDSLVYIVPFLFIATLWIVSVRNPAVSSLDLVLFTAILAPVFAPYGWVSDYAIALPALLALFLSASDARFSRGAVQYLVILAVSAPMFVLPSGIYAYVCILPLLWAGTAWLLLPER